MSFKGKSEERFIKTSFGRTFKMILTEQNSGYWIATLLYVKDDGDIVAHNESDRNKTKVYIKASDWVLNNLDSNATIELLS